jgi:hypothetical protein
MSDYKITKPQKIRFNCCGGASNINEVHELLIGYARSKGYQVTFYKHKQRGQTPLFDLKLEICEDSKRFEVIDKGTHIITKDNMTSTYYSRPS